MRKLRKGDEVVVIAGKDKGRRGEIDSVLQPKKAKFGKKARRGLRVIVKGINMVKKCIRANPNQDEKGRIIDREAPLDSSNVAIWNPITKKADRVGFKYLEDGTKVRCFKSTGEVIDI